MTNIQELLEKKGRYFKTTKEKNFSLPVNTKYNFSVKPGIMRPKLLNFRIHTSQKMTHLSAIKNDPIQCS